MSTLPIGINESGELIMIETGANPPEPTGEQCSSNARIEWEGRSLFACYYPQMGGYGAKCLVEPLGGCFDVWIWHDGAFPFSDDDDRGPVRHLHHCDANQFVRFGEWVNSLSD